MSVLAHETEDEEEWEEELPAWSLPATALDSIRLPGGWMEPVTRDWAFGGGTGRGGRVCVLDSGIELAHPLVGTVARSVAVVKEGEEIIVREDEEGDLCGHGNAGARVIRSIG